MIQEKIVETKVCKQCNSNFEIINKDLEFYNKISPVFAGKKYNIPTPTLCPDCRLQKKYVFRNERNIYKRKCDLTGKEIISIYSPDKNYIVYNSKDWRSDKWNPMDYNLDGGIDFSKGFFSQFNDFLKTIPLPAILNSDTENAEFNNYINRAKNCYLSFVVYNDSENIYYSSFIFAGINIFDCFNVYSSENCYSCIDITNCYDCFYSYLCDSSKNCYFSRSLKGCSFCIGCANLVNKSYCIKNKQYSKQDYFNQLKTILDNDKKKEYLDFIKKEPFLFTNNLNSVDCTGDYLKDCKNCKNSFDVKGSEDSKFIYAEYSKNCYDGIGGTLENCYEFTRTGRSQKCLFVNDILESDNILYSMFLQNCKNCFGCVGLKNKQYCLFNKQYTKEEYEILVPKIIEHMIKTGEWGEFFPSSMSPFGYNETVAMEYYPLTKQEAIGQTLGLLLQENECRGEPCVHHINGRFNWSTYQSPFPKVEKIIPANKLPENISDIPDDILNWAIECEITKKPFRIIAQELEFYRKHNLPIPRRHPDKRHLDRMALRNPRKLFDRKCDKCQIDMKTTYSPDREEIVYCEECYNKEVY